jgi:hypothetical protein
MAGSPTVGTKTGSSPAGQSAATKAPPPQVFRVGVYETDTPDIDVTLASSTSAQKLGTFKISPNGWLAGIWCLFQGSGFTGGSYAGDNPWSGINKVTFRDVGNREIVGPLTGYEWFAINKYGGYFPAGPDPRNPTFFAAAATGFQFLLFLPLEIVYRDTLGEIENKSSSASYVFEVYIDTTANTATVTGTITWRMRCNLYGYTEPEAADSHGRPFSQAPPAAGTVQYWASEIYNSPAGLAKYNQQNGIGYSIRNLLYINYDNSAGTRAAGYSFAYNGTTGLYTGGDWPDPLTLAFGKVQLLQRPAAMWGNLMAKWFGWTTGGGDVFNGLENGVFIEAFNREFDTAAGNELRNGYLVTKAGNVLQISGTFAAADNVHVVTNYIVPPGNDAARLRAR